MSGRGLKELHLIHTPGRHTRRALILQSSKSLLSHLIIHGEEWNIRQRPVNGLPTRLQEVLETFIVLVGPRQGKEVGIVDGPVEWCICRMRLLLNYYSRRA